MRWGVGVQSNVFVDDVIAIHYHTVTSVLLAVHYQMAAE